MREKVREMRMRKHLFPDISLCFGLKGEREKKRKELDINFTAIGNK